MFTKKIWLPLMMGATILATSGCSHTSLPTDQVPQDVIAKPSASANPTSSTAPTSTATNTPTSTPSTGQATASNPPNEDPSKNVPTSFPKPKPDPSFIDSGPIDKDGNLTGSYYNGGDKPPVASTPKANVTSNLPEVKGKGTTQDKTNVAQSYINYTNAFHNKDFAEACKYVNADAATCVTKLSTRDPAFFDYPEGIRVYHLDNIDVEGNIAKTNIWTFIYNGNKQISGRTLIQSPKNPAIWFVE